MARALGAETGTSGAIFPVARRRMRPRSRGTGAPGAGARQRRPGNERVDVGHLAAAASAVMAEDLLGFERGHAARARRGDRLAVLLVLDIAGREHPRDRGLRRTRRGQDVALVVGGELAAEERRVRD